MTLLQAFCRSPRTTYRHGDLRRALLEAGIGLARRGGPDAVVLREATRQAGVAPNAAYRHFASRQDLLDAVRAAALSAVATAMEEELATVPTDLSAADLARARVRAIGISYLRFAQAEPGLFRTALAATGQFPGHPAGASAAGPGGLSPFELLSAALDDLVQAGVLPPERRAGAEFLAWSAVHGLAMLVIDGPLGQTLGNQVELVGQRVLDMIEKGL